MESSYTALAGDLRRLAGCATVALAALGLLAPWPARANEFTINACQADRGEFSTRAFEDFANRGMMWKRACDPEGPGLRGLVTANVVRAGRVVGGSRSYFVMKAPEGTRFARLTWSGQARRQDCRYALQVWADRPDGSSVAIKNVRANRGCPNQGKSQAAGWPAAHTYDIGGATKVVQRVLCVGSNETPYCSARGLNYIRTFKAQATVVDVSPPGVTVTQDNPFTRGEWVNGTQQVDYAALDNVGVRAVRPVFAGVPYGDTLRPCNYAERVPCSNGEGSVVVDTTNLNDGSQPLILQAEDAAGNPGQSPAATVRVDNTAPGAVPIEIGGEGWRNQNDFDAAWTNPDEGDRAPITAARYRLCPIGGSECVIDRRLGDVSGLADLTVPSPGEWHLRIWREDAAGNQQPANASVPVALRYDPEPPQLAFEAPLPSDPTLVSALVTDKLSGLAGGQIELSAEGSGTWQSLVTRQDGSRLLTRIDDARFPAGPYALRATARDQAANQNSTELRFDGRPMTIRLPLRTPTTVTAGVVRRRPVRRREQHRKARRQRTVLVQRARVPFGRQVKITGHVRSHHGGPLPGAEVQVLSRSATSPEQVVAVLRTDRQGRYVYIARASSSSVLRAVYAGTPTTLPSQREVTLLVPAASAIHGRPRRVLNGQSVTFVGQLRSLPVPATGKLVELQVLLSGQWQTFRTTRTSPTGVWRVHYRFRRSCGLLRYRFRARLPAESGYPFEAGHTPGVNVRVRGGPC
jgi:hypothetical protein